MAETPEWKYSVEATVTAAVGSVEDMAPFERARAALAVDLARKIDQMGAEDSSAPVAKELRALLAELEAVEDDDGLDLSPSLGD